MRARLVSLAAVALAAALAPAARAYPSAVVFAPNAEAKPLGAAAAFAYGSLVLSPSAGARPGVAWTGAELGVMPRVPYGGSGVSFGGMELGLDLFGSDLAGTGAAYVKPLVNAKVQIATEANSTPSVAVGLMDVAPWRPERSLNLFYGSTTKRVRVGGCEIGRVTLGLGWVANDFAGDRFGRLAPAFTGSWPFAHDARVLVLGGYESPAFGPVSLAVDHVGGVSEVSSTNLAANVAITKGTTWAIGGWVSNDVAARTGGVFTFVAINVEGSSR